VDYLSQLVSNWDLLSSSPKKYGAIFKILILNWLAFLKMSILALPLRCLQKHVSLIEAEFEYVCSIDGISLFRKRK
jgi:hypothetical protein